MLSTSGILSVALMLLSGMALADPITVCPQTHREGSKVGRLADADVFQGPPEKRASMIPDLETSEWTLAGYQENSKNRGESLYLVCRYKGIT
ncbi:MAG TPA: STY0301 family protein, partial [Telluria sp.]|nr:STY0301 family protein [Telluria sp.]